MTLRVKHWKKDKSFTTTLHQDGETLFLYDGRSKEYKEWMKNRNVVFVWSDKSVEIQDAPEGYGKRAVVLAIFEAPKALEII